MRVRPERTWRDAVLRVFDLGIILVASPLIALLGAVIALAIKIDSPGPVLYRARRIGARGRPFDMLKFRKMRQEAEGAALTGLDDERFTPIGRFLAVTRLDELPQVWNVLKGEMRLVGPRPEVEAFIRLHEDEYAEIHRVMPGITGLAQLRFAGEARLLAGVEDMTEHYGTELLPAKLELDRRYIESRGVLMDLSIIALTVLLPLRALWRYATAVSTGVSPARAIASALAAALLVTLLATFAIQAST